MNESGLLMHLAFASRMGMLPHISTPHNLVADRKRREAGLEGLKFFSFAAVGAI